MLTGLLKQRISRTSLWFPVWVKLGRMRHYHLRRVLAPERWSARQIVEQFLRDLPAAHTDGKSHDISAIHVHHHHNASVDFSFSAMMSVLSVLAHHPQAPCFLYARARPRGSFWRLVEDLVTYIPVPEAASLERHDQNLAADIFRLAVHYARGGLTLTTDTLILRSFAHLAAEPLVAGLRAAGPGVPPRIGSAVLAGRQHSIFLKRWLRAIEALPLEGAQPEGSSSQGITTSAELLDDARRCAHVLALFLYARNPQLCCLMRHDAFYFPPATHTVRILFSEQQQDLAQELVREQYALEIPGELHPTVNLPRTAGDHLDDSNAYAQLCRRSLDHFQGDLRAKIFERVGYHGPKVQR